MLLHYEQRNLKRNHRVSNPTKEIAKHINPGSKSTFLGTHPEKTCRGVSYSGEVPLMLGVFLCILGFITGKDSFGEG